MLSKALRRESRGPPTAEALFAAQRGAAAERVERVFKSFFAARLAALRRRFFGFQAFAEFFGVFFDFFVLVFERFAFELGAREFLRFDERRFGGFVFLGEELVDRERAQAVEARPRFGDDF